MKRIDWLRLCVLSFVWGGSFLFYRMLAVELPPLTTVLSRCAIGAAAIFAYLRVNGVPLAIPRAQLPKLILLATINNAVPFTLFAWAETRVTGGVASIINAATPILTLLVGALVFRNETLGLRRVTGIVLGMLGVAVVVGPGVLLGADATGQIACLMAPICYSFAFQVARRITGMAPPSLACAQLGLAALMILPLSLAIDTPWTLPGLSAIGWIAVAGLGLLSTGFAYVIFFRILASAGPTNLSLVTQMVPVSALLLGWLVLGEQAGLQAAAGMVLIAFGLAVIDGRLLTMLRQTA